MALFSSRNPPTPPPKNLLYGAVFKAIEQKRSQRILFFPALTVRHAQTQQTALLTCRIHISGASTKERCVFETRQIHRTHPLIVRSSHSQDTHTHTLFHPVRESNTLRWNKKVLTIQCTPLHDVHKAQKASGANDASAANTPRYIHRRRQAYTDLKSCEPPNAHRRKKKKKKMNKATYTHTVKNTNTAILIGSSQIQFNGVLTNLVLTNLVQ